MRRAWARQAYRSLLRHCGTSCRRGMSYCCRRASAFDRRNRTGGGAMRWATAKSLTNASRCRRIAISYWHCFITTPPIGRGGRCRAVIAAGAIPGPGGPQCRIGPHQCSFSVTPSGIAEPLERQILQRRCRLIVINDHGTMTSIVSVTALSAVIDADGSRIKRHSRGRAMASSASAPAARRRLGVARQVAAEAGTRRTAAICETRAGRIIRARRHDDIAAGVNRPKILMRMYAAAMSETSMPRTSPLHKR